MSIPLIKEWMPIRFTMEEAEFYKIMSKFLTKHQFWVLIDAGNCGSSSKGGQIVK